MNNTEWESLTREQLLALNELLENEIDVLEMRLEQAEKNASDYDTGYEEGYEEGNADGYHAGYEAAKEGYDV